MNFNTRCRKQNDNGGYTNETELKPVDGKLLILNGSKFFIHKPAVRNIGDRTWRVSDYRTGLYVIDGQTQKDVKQRLADFFNREEIRTAYETKVLEAIAQYGIANN